METRPNIILYLSYWDSVKNMTERQKGQLLDLLFLYQLGEKLPKVDPVVSMAFSFISADIRRNNEKYNDISEKRRAAGKKGAAATNKSGKSANAANADKEKEKEIENDKDKENETVCVETQTRTREDDTHTKAQSGSKSNRPEKSEVLTRFAKDGRKDAEDFWQYNEAKCWIYDFETAYRKWCEKDTRGQPGGGNQFHNVHQREQTHDEAVALERQLLAAQRSQRT